jgi:hypothetical protein
VAGTAPAPALSLSEETEQKEDEMKTKVITSVLLLMGVVVLGCSQGMMATKPSGPPPVITNFYCVNQGVYGNPIKIYLAAEDPDGSMEKITVSVSQVGYGMYFPNWTYLKSQYLKKFVGYLMWDTESAGTSYMPEWTRLTISVSVFDRAGNQSNTVTMPYMFALGGPTNLPMPAVFNQRGIPRLGYVDIALMNPEENSDRF